VGHSFHIFCQTNVSWDTAQIGPELENSSIGIFRQTEAIPAYNGAIVKKIDGLKCLNRTRRHD